MEKSLKKNISLKIILKLLKYLSVFSQEVLEAIKWLTKAQLDPDHPGGVIQLAARALIAAKTRADPPANNS